MRRAATTMMAATGWVEVNQASHTASRSSPRLRAQLLTGSGTVLTAARVEALVPCAVSATPPARRAAAQRQCGEMPPAAPQAMTAPAGGGARGCAAGHRDPG